MFKSTLLVCLAMISLGMPACSGVGGEQGEVNEIVQDISGDLVDLFNQFAIASNCEEAQQILTNLTGTILCDQGGNSTAIITNIVCTEDPLTVSFKAMVTTDDCSAGGNNSNGSYTIDVTIGPASDTALVNGDDFIINGLNFSFSNFSVNQDSAAIVSCAGALTVNGSVCAVNAACTQCPL